MWSADRGNSDGERLVTITLVNATETNRPINEKSFFQCGFIVRVLDGSEFHSYPERAGGSIDDEDASLALLYRHRPTFAVGHGCAAEWSTEGARVSSVRTEVLPVHRQTPIVPADNIAGAELAMEALSTANREEVLRICNALTAAYSEWIEIQAKALTDETDLPNDLRKAGRKHIDDCRQCLRRIVDGIELLRDDEYVFDAFRMMNRAMLEQREHYALSSETEKRRPWEKTDSGAKPARPYAEPQYSGTKWRPFQLAFILMNLRADASIRKRRNAASSTSSGSPRAAARPRPIWGLPRSRSCCAGCSNRERRHHCADALHFAAADDPAVPARGIADLRTGTDAPSAATGPGRHSHLDRPLGRIRRDAEHA